MQKKYKRCIGILIGLVLTGTLLGIIFSIGRVPIGNYALNYDLIKTNYSDNQVYGPGIYYIGIANTFLKISSLQETLSFPNISAYSSDFYAINASLLVSYSLPNNSFDLVSSLYVEFGPSPTDILSPLIRNQIITTLSSYPSSYYQTNIAQIYPSLQSEIQTALTVIAQQWTSLQFNVLIASIQTEAATTQSLDSTIDLLIQQLSNVKNQRIDFTDYLQTVRDRKMREINFAQRQMIQKASQIQQLLQGAGQSNVTNLLFNTLPLQISQGYLSVLERLVQIGRSNYAY